MRYLVILFIPWWAWATDSDAVKLKAQTCAACHGENGISMNELWPNLAGQKEKYLVVQLQAFRDGSRVNSLMSGMAKTLSDQDMKDLAAYFSGIKTP